MNPLTKIRIGLKNAIKKIKNLLIAKNYKTINYNTLCKFRDFQDQNYVFFMVANTKKLYFEPQSSKTSCK